MRRLDSAELEFAVVALLIFAPMAYVTFRWLAALAG